MLHQEISALVACTERGILPSSADQFAFDCRKMAMNVELRWPTVPATVQMHTLQMSTQGKFLSWRQVATTGESVHPRMDHA